MTRIDHITVVASTLDDGVAWAASRLDGIVPPHGGAHPRMGTHNHLLHLGDRVFLEIIAPDPAVPLPPRRPRWFALDDDAFLASLRRDGPRLATWVVRTDDIAAVAARSPLDVGVPERVGRGALEWLITVPADGSLPAGGVMPTLIQWPDDRPHPATGMADAGVRLVSLTLHTPEPAALDAALDAIAFERAAFERAAFERAGVVAVSSTPSAPRLVAVLSLPSGKTVVFE